MDAGRGLEGRSVPCGRFPSLFAASVWSVREAAPRRQFRLLLVRHRFLRFEKPLERPIAPVVATASAVGQGCESIEILRGPSGNTGREGSCRRRAERRHALSLRLQRPAKTLVRLLREALTGSCASRSPGFSISRLQLERSDLVRRRTPSGRRPRVNRLRLRASAARTARPPCGESLFELTFQTLGRDVMFGLNLRRDFDPDPRGLEADDLHVVGHVLPVRMVIALAFFKRIFTRSLPMNQAHGPIIEVTEPVAPGRTRRSGAPAGRKTLRTARTEAGECDSEARRSDRQTFLPLWGRFLASGYNSCSGTIERKCLSTISSVSRTGLCARSSV